MSNEHSFAKQFLKKQKFKIFVDGKQILNKNIPSFNYPNFKTKLEIDKDLTETSDNIQEIEYGDLNSLGFMIVSEKVTDDERWKFKQGVKYRITRMNPNMRDYNQIPQNHFIEMDNIYKKLRLCGPNAGPRQIGPWIHLTRNKPSKFKIHTSSDLSNYLYASLNPLKSMEKKEFIDVPEIPIMITESGELVCIDAKAKDPFTLGCIGKKRRGKTMLLHNVSDNIHLKNCGRQYHLNDQRGMLLHWCMLQNHKPFIKELELINHHPIRSPVIGLYPNVFDLKEMLYEDEGVSFRISIPFKDFAREHTYWTERIKHWQLKGASLTVFRDLMEKAETKNRKTKEEIMADLQDFIDSEKDKLMFNAIKNRLKDIFNQQFLDVSSGISSKWTVVKGNKKLELSPLSISMITGLIPILQTGHLVRREYYPQIMRWSNDSVISDLNTVLKDGIRTFAFYDEIGEIIKRGKKRTVAWDSIIESITIGGNINLGSVWDTQVYNTLDVDIKANTTHLVVFQTNSKDDLAEIKSTYDLPQKFVDNIKHAKKLHAVALTTDDDFIVYSPDEEKPYRDNSPCYGRIIPSMSFHKPPSYVEEE